MTRAEYVESLVGVTAVDIAADMDAASEEDDYWAALLAALVGVGWHQMTDRPEDRPIFTRITPPHPPRHPPNHSC